MRTRGFDQTIDYNQSVDGEQLPFSTLRRMNWQNNSQNPTLDTNNFFGFVPRLGVFVVGISTAITLCAGGSALMRAASHCFT